MLKNRTSKSPVTFSEIMHNPRQDYAEGALCVLITQMEHVLGLKPPAIADLLLKYVMYANFPQAELNELEIVRWHAQLKRFRDVIDKELDAAEPLYQACKDGTLHDLLNAASAPSDMLDSEE